MLARRIGEQLEDPFGAWTYAFTAVPAATSSPTIMERNITTYHHTTPLSVLNNEQRIAWEVQRAANDAEDTPLRLSTAAWHSFENFFNTNRYQPVDNSHNLGSHQFLRLWSQWFQGQESGYRPNQYDSMPPIRSDKGMPVPREGTVSAHDLAAEGCNFQGLSWKKLGTTSSSVREARRKTYSHRTNKMDDVYASPPFNDQDGSYRVRRYMDSSGMDWAKEVARCDNHFRFRRMFVEHRPHLAHFQLRNMVSTSSKNAVFYAAEKTLYPVNPQTGNRHSIMNLSHWHSPGQRRGTITTISASDSFLIAGGWQGQYAMKSSLSDDDNTKEYTEGMLSQASDASINHIHTFCDRRSGMTHAALSSNDCYIRILDCCMNAVVRAHKLPSAINCSVTSPDGRLRLFVGDQTEPWILDDDTGELLVRLPNHSDFGFACDWAPDGVHAATGNQDGIVQIWDSRNWSQPFQILSTELSGVRVMRFSPLGSGKRVLTMAEPADLVSIVDAETFESKQTFGFLGEIGGLSFTPDGQRLYVGNTDRHHGGILEFERAGDGEKYGMARPDLMQQGEWSVDTHNMDDDLLLQSSRSRKRRAIGLEEVII